LTSLNRYERKKGVDLAIRAFAKSQVSKSDSILVVAGGYDPRVTENVEHHLELVKIAQEEKVESKVVFLRSISNDDRALLLSKTRALLYTPINEHFGIVPVEAMYMGPIVLACNSGGPTESIKHGKSGFLLEPEAGDWADQLD
jgi:alpha-1,3/alpha-1,6-mannosyltransferase